MLRWIAERLSSRRLTKQEAAAECLRGIHCPLECGPPELRGLCVHCGEDVYALDLIRMLFISSNFATIDWHFADCDTLYTGYIAHHNDNDDLGGPAIFVDPTVWVRARKIMLRDALESPDAGEIVPELWNLRADSNGLFHLPYSPSIIILDNWRGLR